MKIRFVILLNLFFWVCIGFSNAQKSTPDHFHDAEGNTYHQVFVDFHISELYDIQYVDDQSPVIGELSTDGYSVIIKNYPGNCSVKLRIRTDSGEEKEITKSRCYIDPVLLEL